MKRIDSQVSPDVLVAAAQCARAALAQELVACDWGATAGDLNWTARETLDHMCNALALYTLHLGTRARERLPAPRNGDRTASIADLLVLLEGLAKVLAEVARATPSGTRAFHPAGMADAEGFLAMGCDEILVHTADIIQGFGSSFRPPDEMTTRVLLRLFPWAPAGDSWEALLWANGRLALPGHPRLGEDWYWHCAPLIEWDGKVKKRTAPPAWS